MSEAAADLPARLQHLERLIRDMEEGPETPTRARARGMVQAVLDLHAEALRRMMQLVAAADGTHPGLVHELARDPEVAGVLLLHGLHPLEVEARVDAALEALAPTLRAHGVRLASVVAGESAVRVRLEREVGHAARSTAALRARLEDALAAAAPEAATIEVEVPADPPAFVPLEQVRLRARPPQAPSP